MIICMALNVIHCTSAWILQQETVPPPTPQRVQGTLFYCMGFPVGVNWAAYLVE